MESNLLWRWGAIVGIALAIQACGGGGGGGGGSNPPPRDTSGAGKSLSQIIEIYTQLREEAYRGATTQATLDESNALSFIRAELSSEFPVDPASSRIARAKLPVLSKPDLEATAKWYKQTQSLNGVTARERIDETQPCDNDEGTVHVTGDLNDIGAGAIDLQYDRCVIGGVEFNGSAIAYSADGMDVDYSFYNALRSTSEGQTISLTGSVELAGDGSVVSSIVAEDVASGYQYQLVDYREYIYNQSIEYRSASVSGRLYLPAYGWVAMEGAYDLQNNYGAGSLLLNTDDNSLSILIEGSTSRLLLTPNDKPENVLGAVVPTEILLHYYPTTTIELVPLSQLPQPPTYSQLTSSRREYGHLESIEVTVTGLTDPNGDELEITYHWYVNGVEISGVNSNVLPAGTANPWDYVWVYADITDGVYSISTYSLDFSIIASASEVVAVDAPEFIEINDELALQVRYQDADNPGVEIGRIELAYGPEGAVLD